MNVKIVSGSPKPRGIIGKQKTEKIWHFLSHYSGGNKVEENYIQKSCGLIESKSNTSWFSENNKFEADKFWLAKHNTAFTMRFHSLGLCYVDHYYFAELVNNMIELTFIGQYQSFNTFNKFKLYSIGDELKTDKWFHKLFR